MFDVIIPSGGQQCNSFLSNRVRPNQSLKLTEIAVDDFAARWAASWEIVSINVRATSYTAAAVRRRSLAPVR
jgi:hypothetical protein